MEKFEIPWLEERLKKIASVLIDSHRSGRQDILDLYAKRLGKAEAGSPKRQFMRLIQIFHPDRLAVFSGEVALLRAAGDEAGLSALEKLLEFETAHASRSSHSSRREQRGSATPSPEDGEGFGFSENYGYDSDDFGYDEETEDEASFGVEDYEEEDIFADGSFMDAIKREFFGNLDLYPTKHEIEQFEGELDLSDYSLNDLSGAEYCVHLFSLNLAMNRIDNIWPLRELTRLEFLDLSSNDIENADELGEMTGLKELDLSFNEIEDISFLLRLPSLKCVSLAGNPVKNPRIIEILKKQGTLVIL